MTLSKDIEGCIIEMLNKHEIKYINSDRDKILKQLTDYINILIFNIISICSIISLHIGIAKLTEQHLIYMREHLDKRCSLNKKTAKKFTGGAFNTAAFYGIEEKQYSVENKMGNIMNVDFENGIARPELKGGNPHYCKTLDKIVLKKISNVFKFYKVKVQKNIKEYLNKIFLEYLEQMFLNLKKSKPPLSIKKLNMILSKTKIMKK